MLIVCILLLLGYCQCKNTELLDNPDFESTSGFGKWEGRKCNLSLSDDSYQGKKSAKITERIIIGRLMDNLLPEKWAEVSQDKKDDSYQQYQVHTNHKQTGDNQFSYLIYLDGEYPIRVTIYGTKKGKDPFENVRLAELKLDNWEYKIIGIDLDGDFVEFKS